MCVKSLQFVNGLNLFRNKKLVIRDCSVCPMAKITRRPFRVFDSIA